MILSSSSGSQTSQHSAHRGMRATCSALTPTSVIRGPFVAQTVGRWVASPSHCCTAIPHGSDTTPLADNRPQSSANPVEFQVLSSA
jgi:hypothetical protein